MKIYIFADLEGISGISGTAYIDGVMAATGSKLMIKEINNCINSCFDAGASEVFVRDGHGSGINFPADAIDKRAYLIQGGGKAGVRFPGLDGTDGIILLGYHAMAGTPEAVLEHTYSSKSTHDMILNGRNIGEIGMDAIIAAEHRVPIILVTGDDKTCIEAQEWLPNVPTCCVKIGLACSSAICLPEEKSSKLIYDSVKSAIANMDKVEQIKVDYPITLRWVNSERCPVPHAGYKIIDGRTFERTGDSLEDIFLN